MRAQGVLFRRQREPGSNYRLSGVFAFVTLLCVTLVVGREVWAARFALVVISVFIIELVAKARSNATKRFSLRTRTSRGLKPPMRRFWFRTMTWSLRPAMAAAILVSLQQAMLSFFVFTYTCMTWYPASHGLFYAHRALSGLSIRHALFAINVANLTFLLVLLLVGLLPSMKITRAERYAIVLAMILVWAHTGLF